MEYNFDQINKFVLTKQHLADESETGDIVQVVKDIAGLHAQVPATPYLSLFARVNNFAKAQLDEELYFKKNLARIKCIRSTLYILPKDTICAAFAATKRMLEMPSDKYTKYLGLTKQNYESISEKIVEIIHDHGLTTKEIKKELGLSLDVSLIVNLMCDQGLLIRGIPKAGWKSNIHTYYRFCDYLPGLDLNADNEENARKLIVKQYLASFGPVTENDIAWWTGFPKREIKQLVENLGDRIIQLEISNANGDYFLLSSDEKQLKTVGFPTKQTVNLLPVLDPYIMGYKERKRYLDYNYYDNVFDFNGNATSTILVDGKIIGIWDFIKEKKSFIKIYFFEKPEKNALTKVFYIADKIGRFIMEEEVEIKECKSMIPLTHRTAGGYMSPLKGC